jgi:hypothetical protein
MRLAINVVVISPVELKLGSALNSSSFSYTSSD